MTSYYERNKEAILAKRKAHYAQNAEQVKARVLARQRNNHDAYLAYQRAYAADNTDVAVARTKAWREANPEKAKVNNTLHSAQWRVHNRAAYNQMQRARVSRMKKLPAWADVAAINGMYELAQVFRRIGMQMEVDHVVPLQGKTVSGLHVETNLQLLVQATNRKKSNKIEVPYQAL